jgi:hypothetical protein
VRAKTPLAEVFYFLPATAPENLLLACNRCGKYPAHWEPQEKGVMSIAASFSSVKKPRYVDLGEERQMTEGDAC